MALTLSDLDDRLDLATLERLGDPILYTAEGGAPTAMKAFVDQSEGTTSYGGSAAVAGDRTFELMRSAVPVRPSEACTIHIVATGEDFIPIGAKLDSSGRWWIGKLKKKP